jgi:hypothetical protein
LFQITRIDTNVLYRFVQEEDPEASVHNLESLEHFMSIKIGSIDGMVGIDGSQDAGLNTALGYWKDFTAAWRRKYGALPGDTIESIRNVRTGWKSLLKPKC